MASPNYNSIKIHEHYHVSPPSSTHSSSYPLTFFDLLWLRFHPVERIFFYKFPIPQTESESDPSSFFFDKLVPKLKTSLSHTLQHFLPLAGNIVWPSDSETPFIQYNPGDDDGVSLLIAESHADFNHILDNKSPHEASESRSFVPHLDSSDSHASVISLQVTLIPNSGFCIGISTHHAVLDGKSSTMFIKAWASICKLGEESLVPELEPFFDRKVIKDSTGANIFTTNNLTEMLSKMFSNDNSNGRSLKILPFPPKVEHSARATFELTRADLEKIKKRVLSKWDTIVDDEAEPPIASISNIPKPHTLSTFVLTCAYVSTCIAKAIQRVEREREKFAFGFTVDCRARLPPIPGNYFGNCVWGQFVDAKPMDYIKEDGVVIVAKMIYHKIKKLDQGGVFDGAKDMFSKYMSLSSEKVEIMGLAGSNRFCVYGVDFGWGRPSKVEITSIDRGLTIGISESKDGSGGIEVGLVLNKNVMDLFSSIFHEGLCID